MTGPYDVVSVREALQGAASALEPARSDRTQPVSTGHSDLDDLLGGGFWPGQLHVVVSSPGVGRSMFMLNLTRAAAMRGVPALYASPQHDRDEVTLRLLATECKVPLNHLRAGLLTADDRAKIDRHRNQLAELPVHLATSPMLRLEDVLASAGRLVPRPRLVAVDGIPNDELAKAGRSLAQSVRLMQTTVVVSIVLPDHAQPPVLRDVPAALAEAADVVLGLYREDMHEPESLRPGEADIHVLKSRHSPSRGPMPVAFQGHYARFVDMAR